MKLRQFIRSNRGAVLVEAVVVLPVLLGFFGFLRYTHLSYTMRLALQETSHRDVLTAALPGCKKDSEGGSFGAACGSGGPEMGTFSVTSKRAGTVAFGQLSRTTNGESYLLCNEEGAGGSAESTGSSINGAKNSPPPSTPGCQ
jgi:Flp pilus assembly protein TadG